MSAPPAAISPDPAPNTPSAHPRRAHASRPKLTVARGRRVRAPAPPAVAVIDAHRHFIDEKVTGRELPSADEFDQATMCC
jgi:hypothetical protein